MKNVIVFGNHKIAINCTEILLKTKDIRIVKVVGCEIDRDKELGVPSLEEYCKKKSIPYIHANNIDQSFIKSLKKLQINFCFSFYYRKIFKKEFLTLARYGFINIHPGLLPRYRGPVPSMWALLNGESIVGTTIHYIDQGIDTGDIIAQKKFLINESISGFELNNKLIDEGIKLFKKTLPQILSNKAKREKQNHSIATYYGAFNNSLRIINWYAPKTDILNKIRTFREPYAGTSAEIDGEHLIIWSAEIAKESKIKLQGPGKIIKTFKDGSFVVSTVDGFLKVTNYAFEKNDARAKRHIAPNKLFTF